MISAIAAIGRNRELGLNNDLLWKIPDDLKRFRDLTRGHPVIMGRKTFESIVAITGKPLPNRANIVITADQTRKIEGVEVVHSIDAALAIAEQAAGSDEIFIIGGAQIYGPVSKKIICAMRRPTTSGM